jgi:hypothetical protein
MKNCTDCANWNPDTPDTAYCNQDDRPDVADWWASTMADYRSGQLIDCQHCPGFVQNPWNSGLDLAQNGQLSHT